MTDVSSIETSEGRAPVPAPQHLATPARRPLRRGRMLLVAAAAMVLAVSATSCQPQTVSGVMPGVWRFQQNFQGAIYTEEWVIHRNGWYNNSLSGPGVFTAQEGTWSTINSQNRFRLNVPTSYYPTQYCGPLGCTPIERPPGESFVVTIINNNQIRTRSLATGVTVTRFRFA